MLMKSSISFSKNTLFSQSVSSASISSVWRRIDLAIGGVHAANRFPQPLSLNVLSLTAAWHPRRWSQRLAAGQGCSPRLAFCSIFEDHPAAPQSSMPPRANCCSESLPLLPVNDRRCVLPGQESVRSAPSEAPVPGLLTSSTRRPCPPSSLPPPCTCPSRS